MAYPDYALHSLGWSGFQHLCGTILKEELGQTFQVFADGNDAGRDGAFMGSWESQKGESLTGNTTVQCKFSNRLGKSLSASDLTDEVEKARRLAQRGLADNYLLITNCSLTASSEAEIRQIFESIPGLSNCLCYGRHWICTTIAANKRLRMLVPRLYGLGDLTQILDERAYDQAKAILHSLEEDLSKFVMTKAHHDSVSALNKHRFVLLLGEPACGKSTIASALALGAGDLWGSQLIKVESPEEFHAHWNPNEGSQFFWIDDAFGQTQYERQRALSWNYAFPKMAAAIKQGAFVVFTSRDYIYRAALDDLKEETFPLLREVQVVIEVQKLLKREKEQILYNHLKLGGQPSEFRSSIKPFLKAIAKSDHFLPEMARRLGHPFFTKQLYLDQESVMEFVEKPHQFLYDTTKHLDSANRAALGMIFMRGGDLLSLRNLRAEEERALALLGTNLGDVRKALKSLNGTMVVQTQVEGAYTWRFKHPTIRDAYGAIVADEPDLMDIYMAGTRIDSLLTEVTCGQMKIKGVKLVVPSDKWPTVITRLDELDRNDKEDRKALYDFLEDRCNREFLRTFLRIHPEFISSLRYRSYIRYDSAVSVASRLFACRLLPEAERKRFVAEIGRLALWTPDADFLLVPKIRALFKSAEILEVSKRPTWHLLTPDFR